MTTENAPPVLADAGLDRLVARVRSLVDPLASGRLLLGIAGAPGSGKTSLARALVGELQRGHAEPFAAHLPMDGFHLADVELDRLGRRERKGAPDTFDAAGYETLLVRLRTRTQSTTVWAPAFDREIEQPIAGSIAVEPEVRVVVSEGNYLLLDEPVWRSVRSHFQEVWFVRPDEAERQRRLIDRHIRFGKTPAAARTWALGTDEHNAALVAAGEPRADLILAGDVRLL